jgi:hypothetical protein
MAQSGRCRLASTVAGSFGGAMLTSVATYRCRGGLVGGGVADGGILASSVCGSPYRGLLDRSRFDESGPNMVDGVYLVAHAVTAVTNYLPEGGVDIYDADGAADSFSLVLQHLFTRGDLDYILDSLSVLVLCRFLMSSMLGTGGR